MTITLNSPLIGTGGTVAEALAHMTPPTKDEQDYADELFRLCQLTGLDFRILFSQAVHETDSFLSKWWKERRNPAGLGVTGDPAQDAVSPTFANGTDAARAQVVHMAGYVGYKLWPDRNPVLKPYVSLDPRLKAIDQAGFAGSVLDLRDLGNGKWAADSEYAQQIAAKANAIFADHPQEASMTTYPVAGLPGPGIALPVPLIIDLIPTSQTNQRPGIPRQTPGYWVQHETANYAAGADARMHNTWLHNGAGGAQLSFHFCVDDHQIYQMIPVNEVTWQAADGAGPGNMAGVSCELCVNSDGDTAKSRANAEALAGGVMKALGLNITRLKRHWDFNAADPNRHHCPDEMMTSGYWDDHFVPNVTAILAPNAPEYATPLSIPFKTGDTGWYELNGSNVYALVAEVQAKRDNVVCRAWAESDAPKSAKNLRNGEKRIAIGSMLIPRKKKDTTVSERWLILDDKSRVRGSAMTPILPVKP